MFQTRIDDGGRRSGLTRVEVAVLIGIVALLAAFFAPAVRTSGPVAKRLECLNNIRQIGIAMHSYSSAYNGELPPLVDHYVVKRGDAQRLSEKFCLVL